MAKNIKTVIEGSTFELKDITVNEFMSDETICFKAGVYLDGKYLGSTWNEGNGGPTFLFVDETNESEISMLENKLSRYHKVVNVWGKTFNLTFDVELLTNVMVDAAHHENKRVFNIVKDQVMAKFTLYGKIEDWQGDSMLHPSGVICKMEDDNLLAEIRVTGEVKVNFRGRTYWDVTDFPEELKDIIKAGELFENEEVDVDETNWYEINVYEKVEDSSFLNFLDGGVLDWDTVTEDDLKSYCEEWISDNC